MYDILKRHLLALLLVVGFSFGSFNVAKANPPGGVCAPIASWANTYASLTEKGFVPFASFQSDNALLVTLAHPTTQEWVLFSFHGNNPAAGLGRFCLRATGEAAAHPSYNVGKLPDELAVLLKGPPA